MEVPPHIEAKPTVSSFSTLLSHSSNLPLLQDDTLIKAIIAVWLALEQDVEFNPT
jgi:hypothetical protein